MGETSPLARPSKAKVRAQKKPGYAARLSAVLSGAALAAVPGAPCRAEVPRDLCRKAAHSTIANCDSEGVHVPPDVYLQKNPCLTAAYEAAEESLAAERQLWAERHATARAMGGAVSEQQPVLLTKCPPLSAAHTMAVLENGTAPTCHHPT